MIIIIDYGMGNLASVCKAFEYIGETVKISCEPEDIAKASALVLPGVGAMSDAMKSLEQLNLTDGIKNYICTGKPFLGICLGMQMLFDSSSEGSEPGMGNIRGLGVLPGKVIKLPDLPGIKIPHMGWNSLSDVKDPILPKDRSLYFVHSYYAQPADEDIISSKSFHGIEFTSSVKYKNITATQFHPEKSGNAGLDILKAWICEVNKTKIGERVE